MRIGHVVAIAVFGTLFPGSALAQAPPLRGFISLNGGYRIASIGFQDTATFQEHAEDGRFDTEYTIEAGPTFDVAGGAILGRHIGAGVGVVRFARSTTATVNASIPHPFFFSRSRSASGDVPGLQRQELAVHLQARVIVPLGRRLEATVTGGPSFFRIEQDLVNDFTYAEQYPYDAATFLDGVVGTAEGSTIGVNAGADVSFFFTRQVGIGVNVQYSTATISVASPGGGSIALKAGGVQSGGGLRLRF
jgi:hypothetical protein